jgi:hypothetical protein
MRASRANLLASLAPKNSFYFYELLEESPKNSKFAYMVVLEIDIHILNQGVLDYHLQSLTRQDLVGDKLTENLLKSAVKVTKTQDVDDDEADKILLQAMKTFLQDDDNAANMIRINIKLLRSSSVKFQRKLVQEWEMLLGNCYHN